MIGVQNNPFHKPNPFKPIQYQRFEHPHIRPSAQDHQHLIYKQHPRLHNSRILENNWTFNENNLGRKYTFTKKQDMTSSRVSDFQMKMKMSNIGIPNKQTQKVAYVSESRLENPFFRKNLLINKQEVKNQVELEVSLYRPKAKTTYESVPMSVSSMHIENYDDSPVLNKQRSSVGERIKIESPSPNSLVYSQTPGATKRPSDRIIPEQSQNLEETDNPNTISYQGRKFFLNT